MDMVSLYAASKPWVLRPNIVLVEGTSDEALFRLADELSAKARRVLLGDDICVVAAGRRDQGGTYGVARELITLRSMVPLVLDRHGSPVYRVMGLVDNDAAGRLVIKDVLRLDRSAVELNDIMTMRPVSPTFTQSNPLDRQTEYNLANLPYRDLDWEIEDTLSGRVLGLFAKRFPSFSAPKKQQGGKTHYEFTKEAKNELHKLIHREATLDDLAGVVEVISMIRSMLPPRV